MFGDRNLTKPTHPRVPKGALLFVCQECAHREFRGRHELSRAAGIRCSACGSRRLELTKTGQDKLTMAQDAARGSR